MEKREGTVPFHSPGKREGETKKLASSTSYGTEKKNKVTILRLKKRRKEKSSRPSTYISDDEDGGGGENRIQRSPLRGGGKSAYSPHRGIKKKKGGRGSHLFCP